jgi:hypothetical protein
MKNWMKVALALLVVIIVGVVGYFIGQTPPAITKTATVTLDVRPSPSFTLAVTPANIITYPNRTVAYNILCTGVNSFAGDITVSVSGLPTGATAAFLPSNKFTLGLTPAGPQMNITVPDDQALVKVWTLTVTATSTTYN